MGNQLCSGRIEFALLAQQRRHHFQEGDVPGKGGPLFGLSIDCTQCFPTKVVDDLCFDSRASLGVSLCRLPYADASWVITLLQYVEAIAFVLLGETIPAIGSFLHMVISQHV